MSATTPAENLIADVRVPDDLPFLESLSWFDARCGANCASSTYPPPEGVLETVLPDVHSRPWVISDARAMYRGGGMPVMKGEAAEVQVRMLVEVLEDLNCVAVCRVMSKFDKARHEV